MTVRCTSLCLVVWACLAACTLPVVAQTLEAGAIIVTVTDINTGKPIDNAQVFLLGGDTPESSLTNVKGILVFESVQPGSYRVRVDAEGYQQTNSPVDVGEAQRVRVTVALAPTAPLKTIASVVVKASVVNITVEDVNSESAQRKVSQTLSDALNKLAGVSVDNDLYGPGSSFNISLRGADASQTGYSLDGVRLSGAAAQAIGGAQDLFTGASVNFAPSAGNNAGTVNFNTLQPTKLWNYSAYGAVGNYSKTLGVWSATGGFGKLSFALAHSGGGQVGPLNGSVFEDQSGSAYMHFGGFSRQANLVKASLALSPVSTFKYALLESVSNATSICSTGTTILPCGYGNDNFNRSDSAYNVFTFASLLGHVQFNTDYIFGKVHLDGADPNRSVNGIVVPLSSVSDIPGSTYDFRMSSTSRRHTLTAGFFSSLQASSTTSTFNGTQLVQAGLTTRFSSAYFDDRVKANDRLAIDHSISQSSATNSAPSFEVYEDLTWQPAVADVFEAGFGVGGASGYGGYSPTLGDALSGDYDCSNHSVFMQGPTDQPATQSSISYNLAWRHTLRGGSINVSLYRNRFVGQSVRASVPLVAEPSSIFPNGSLADYISAIQQVWSKPAICGSTPFDPSGVYVSQNISGLAQVTQGFSITGQVPIGKNLIVFPTYATTNAYYSALDPRLMSPSSFYGIGLQVPRTPLHKAGLIVDGVIPHTPLEWLADAEFTSANNAGNLPAYTLFNAGLVMKMQRGSLSLLVANIFGTQTALFSSYQGINPLPLQGGGTFAFSTFPLPPRSITFQYQVRWRQHYKPPPPPPSPAPSASPKPALK
jgi:hypothetical protein